ncbi:hypothetical protein [Streptomyces sp. NPDC047803]|uniref:hypothetical protein n=1 Tax=unclassified Streptomyces TaxID=2593676 RepID=UPI0033CFBEC9
MSDARFALIIRPAGTFDVIDWPADLTAGLNLLAQEFNATAIAAHGLLPCVSMWTNVDATPDTAPLNRYAGEVHRAAGYDEQHYYAAVALTGGLVDAYAHTGLALSACHELLRLAGIDVPTMPKPRTK